MTVNSRSLTHLPRLSVLAKRRIQERCWGEEMPEMRPRGPMVSFAFKLTPYFLIQSPTLYFTSGSTTACQNCPHFVTTAFSLLPVFICLHMPKFLLAPVSSLRLKYVYKSAVVKDEANTTKQASLIESLTNSEVNLISSTFYTDVDRLNWPIAAVFWGRGRGSHCTQTQSTGCDGCVVIKPFQKLECT